MEFPILLLEEYNEEKKLDWRVYIRKSDATDGFVVFGCRFDKAPIVSQYIDTVDGVLRFINLCVSSYSTMTVAVYIAKEDEVTPMLRSYKTIHEHVYNCSQKELFAYDNAVKDMEKIKMCVMLLLDMSRNA